MNSAVLECSPFAIMGNMVLANGLHRMKFRQAGQIPDTERIWHEYGPKDGQPFVLKTWMDGGIGFVYLAWKEWQVAPLPGMEKGT